MKIDGKAIAQTILSNLKTRVDVLKKREITPHLVIILIGYDPASETYVGQKVKKGEEIGIKITVEHLLTTITQDELLATIKQYNNNNNIHGIIVQRPLPKHIDEKQIDEAVNPKKDVDGFHPNSQFDMPLAAAVLAILKEVRRNVILGSVSDSRIPTGSWTSQDDNAFINWLKAKKVVVMGKGKTGGGPVLSALVKLGIQPLIIDSKTPNPEHITKTADIIICAVGRADMLTKDMIKKGAILVAVGMFKREDGKMHGDYEEDDVKDIATFYTPTPGGVGPVNVAMLLENVVKAAESFL